MIEMVEMVELSRREAYSLLYEYAKGRLSPENKGALEEYFKTDEESAGIAAALKELYPKLTYANDDEKTHHGIAFMLNNGDRVLYTLTTVYNENYQAMNEYLEVHNGYTPKKERWFSFQQSLDAAPPMIFDNEGNEIEIEADDYEYAEVMDHHVVYAKKMKKVFPVQYLYAVFYVERNNTNPTGWIYKSDLAPNLYEAGFCNYFMDKVKSSVYLALPEKAEHIRIARGNGIIKCGKYKFLYADRYLLAEEGIHAECTFIMN